MASNHPGILVKHDNHPNQPNKEISKSTTFPAFLQLQSVTPWWSWWLVVYPFLTSPKPSKTSAKHDKKIMKNMPKPASHGCSNQDFHQKFSIEHGITWPNMVSVYIYIYIYIYILVSPIRTQQKPMVTCTQAALERTILCKNRCAICFLALSVRRVKHQWHVKRETIYPPAQHLQKTNCKDPPCYSWESSL